MTALDTEIVVRELGSGSPRQWDAFVESCPQATFFRQNAWTAAAAEAFGHRAHCLYAESAGRIRGILPLMHVKSRLFGNALISSGFGVYGGPAADAPQVSDRLDAHAIQLAN